MSSRTLRRTAAALCLAATLAVPAHALPERSPEPFGILTWLSELWSAIWEEATGDEGKGINPEGKPTIPDGDEGHGIDPDG